MFFTVLLLTQHAESIGLVRLLMFLVLPYEQGVLFHCVS